MTTAENNQELTTVGANASASVDQNNQEALSIAEASYQRLRDAVRRYVEAAFEEAIQPIEDKLISHEGSTKTLKD